MRIPNVKGYEIDNFVIEQISNMSQADNAYYDELMNSKEALLFKQRKENELIFEERLSQIEKDHNHKQLFKASL